LTKATSNPGPAKPTKVVEKLPVKTKLTSFSPSPKRPTVKSSMNFENGFSHMSKDEIVNWRARDEEDLQAMSQKHE